MSFSSAVSSLQLNECIPPHPSTYVPVDLSCLCFLGWRLRIEFGIRHKITTIRRIVYSSGPSRRVRTRSKRGIPVHRTFSGACNRLSARNSLFGRLAREKLLEDHTVTVSLLCGWCVVWVTIGSTGKHLIRHLFVCNSFQVINPSVSDAITELFLLSPQNFRRQVWIIRSIKRFPDNILLNPRVLLAHMWPLHNHFFLRIHVHRHLKKVSVQKRCPGFHSPSRHCLVAPQTIVHVKPADFVHRLIKELLLIGCLVKVEVSTKDFISSLSTQDHLNTHGLDLPRHEIHGSRSTNCRHIISLHTLNNLTNGIGTFLNSISVSMMNRPKEISHLLGSLEIRTALKSNGKRVEFGKGRGTTSNITCTDGGNEG
mmetsp:Transcript_5561/g.12325  ORF Transcript_5561/g.12325 Transcript_5561/m.12325 type:complete len:369 (-) Transcript_5561:880-1986(-)